MEAATKRKGCAAVSAVGPGSRSGGRRLPQCLLHRKGNTRLRQKVGQGNASSRGRGRGGDAQVKAKPDPYSSPSAAPSQSPPPDSSAPAASTTANQHQNAGAGTTNGTALVGLGANGNGIAKKKKKGEMEKGKEMEMQQKEHELLASQAVEVSRVKPLGLASSFSEGVKRLSSALSDMRRDTPAQSSGIIRLEVVIPREADVIGWLRRQAKLDAAPNLNYPMLYFSPKTSTFGEGLQGSKSSREKRVGDVAIANDTHEIGCVGSVCLWKGLPGSPFDEEAYNRIGRFLRKGEENIRAFGGIRFDPSQVPSEEWRDFGSYHFLIPAVELRTAPSHSVLSCSIAWDNNISHRHEGECLYTIDSALSNVYSVLNTIKSSRVRNRIPLDVEISDVGQNPTKGEWDSHVNDVLSKLKRVQSNSLSESSSTSTSSRSYSAHRNENGNGNGNGKRKEARRDGHSVEMRKMVLARQSKVKYRNAIEALHLLSCLQDQDRKGYQFCMLIDSERAFFGSTPERLYARQGSHVVSEAVAATTRSSTDAEVTKSLLTSEKEHHEFIVVRNAVKQALESLCTEVDVEVEKEVLKHVTVQHLYGRLSGNMTSGKNDYHLLSALHPTPAVAGYPCKEAVEALSSLETFDRGFYAGPFGWMSGCGSEFAVAIRSALTQKNRDDDHELMMYAGVGIVDGSKPDLEWKELDLKVQQFTRIIQQRNLPLQSFPNTNALVSFLVVEELCRLGVKYFCIAPGSRSTPLVLAAANHPRAEVITCIDERSLGFFALGLAKGNGVPAAVITTSGTAVANLLPAAVEASETNVPLILLTADRPAELQSTGSNQTIDQAQIFGKFARWFRNFPAYTEDIPLRMLLTNISTAWRHATLNLPGPVHLNFEYREPLAPIAQDWDRKIVDKRMQLWEKSGLPYTTNMVLSKPSTSNLAPFDDFMQIVSKCKKGMIVVGTSTSISENLALVETAQKLGWAIVPDVSSGLKLGPMGTDFDPDIIFNLDHILLDEDAFPLLQPECIIQVGRECVSKRISSFVSRSCFEGDSSLVMLGSDWRQRDPSHIATHQLLLEPSTLNEMVTAWLSEHPEHDRSACELYTKYLLELDGIVSKSMNLCFQQVEVLTEPKVARLVSEAIPEGNALFLGNSMPIRDMEMFGSKSSKARGCSPIATSSNRGSSGIDGVISSSAGYAESLGSPVTLVIGDVSFAHDSNGLNLLSGPSSSKRSPLTVVVINNNGGRIFEMLPVAKAIDDSVLESCFVTDPEAEIASLCNAYRIPYQHAATEKDVSLALEKAWSSMVHNVIEIAVDPKETTRFRTLVKEKIFNDLQILSSQNLISSSDIWKGGFYLTIDRVICERVSYPLARQVTTSSKVMERDMMKIAIHATHKLSGKSLAIIGEVSPLPKLHEESFEEAQSQMICVADMLTGSRVPLSIVSQNGSLEAWLSKIGIIPSTLLPSVRFGLESALLDLISSSFGCSALKTRANQEVNTVHVSGLLSSEEDLQSIVVEAEKLVARGFRGIKVKVGRASVEKDIATICKIREKIGSKLIIRCDANRAWSLEEALDFAEGVKDCQIEFIEEPVKDLSTLKAFCDSSPQILVALDESLSDMLRNVTMDSVCMETAKIMQSFSGSLGAVVLKPSVLGSLEKFRAIVDVCVKFGIKPIVSSTFESSIGLYSLAQLSSYVDSAFGHTVTPILHGLGTIDWNTLDPQEGKLQLEQVSFGSLKEGSLAIDTTKYSNKIYDWQEAFSPELSSQRTILYDSARSSLDYDDTIHSGFMTLHRFSTNSVSSSNSVSEVPPTVFIHGFLGAMDDWRPLMSSISSYGDSYAVCLPGHSSSTFLQAESKANQLQNTFAFTSTSLADLLNQSSVRKPILIAYSMGARVALDMVLSFPETFSGLMIISSSPGIEDKASRESRAVKDMLLSTQIRETGLQSFLETWYQQPLFESFKNSPHFMSVVKQRAQIHTTQGLADALIGLSPGLQESLWPKLKHLSVPLCIICGECDSKYVDISHQMVALARESPHLGEEDVQLHTIPGAGHCVHVEAPQALAPILTNFVSHVRNVASSE